MARDGARLVMLGTPNQGAHSMVENLIGKGDTLRTLVRLDLKHDMQQVLDIVAGFRGALQLLPKPGFVDIFQGQRRRRRRSTHYQQARDLDRRQGQGARLLVRRRAARHAGAGGARRGELAVDGRTAPGTPALPADYETKCDLRVRRRAQHAVRRARGGRRQGRERLKHGRHHARRRHRDLGVGPHRRHRQLLLHAGAARRPDVDAPSTSPALIELLDLGRDGAAEHRAAGDRARSSRPGAGQLRRRPADARRSRSPPSAR